MEQSILELVLNYYRSPSHYPELADVDNPLPQGIEFLLDLVAGNIALDTDELQGDLKGISENDLKAASAFYIEQVFFNSNANFYRTLGLNTNATQDQIRHRYSVLIHILCLDQEDKSAQWDDTYAMRINRAYSVLRIPEKRKKYNQRHDIVVSGFAGIEKRSESRKALDRDLEAESVKTRSSLSHSFIAENMDLAYLSREKEPMVDKVVVEETIVDDDDITEVTAATNIDSASPENLYEPYETGGDENRYSALEVQANKIDDGPIINDEETTIFSEQTEAPNVDKTSSRTSMYSLLGALLLVAIGGTVVYFSGSLQTESDIFYENNNVASVETKNTPEPKKIMEQVENLLGEDIVTDVKDESVDLVSEVKVKPENKVPEVKVKEKNDIEAIVIEPAVTYQKEEKKDVKSIDELPVAKTLPLTIDKEERVLDETTKIDDNVVTAEENTVVDGGVETEMEPVIDDQDPVEINPEKFSRVVDDFVHYYNVGDLSRFIALFAKDAKTDDRESINGIRDDYADAFNLTVKRKFLIDDVQWVMLDENNGSGSANFVLFVQALGESRFTEYTGEITFYMETRDNIPLITGLYYQYSE